MNPAFFSSSRSRGPALLAVLLLHLLAAGLLLRPPAVAPAAPVASAVRLIPLKPPAAAPRREAPGARSENLAPALPRIAAPTAISLPIDPAAPQPLAAASPGPASAPASAPLDLRLPSRSGPPPAPRIAELARADPRANSPRESAEERMANALGAQGWRSIDLGDGAKKLMGPFGECYISRPSMVEQVPGHPLQGMVPNKVFGCGGIEKGSLKHERPK